MSIIRKECRLDNLYLIETKQFNLDTITSVYCWYDGDKALLMDAGTSENIEVILNSLSGFGIPASKLVGVIPSHYHFDHGGGCAELWNRMKGINSSFRIYTSSLTKTKLQNATSHLKGAFTTFGNFVGTMEAPPDEAFHLVDYNSWVPVEFKGGARIKLLHTPGHTPDHSSPAVYIGDRCVFCFIAEACGTVYTNNELLSTPSSMPPNFCYSDYVESMDALRGINPEIAGLCHFGVITGEDIEHLFSEHIAFMRKFREDIIKAFNENPSTGHVMNSTEYLWKDRIDAGWAKVKGSELFFGNLRLALTYGMMVDLGFRFPKYEEKAAQQ